MLPFTVDLAVAAKARLKSNVIYGHSQSNFEWHLSVLKDADLIRDTREDKYIFYELNTSVLEDVMLWITDLKGVSNHD